MSKPQKNQDLGLHSNAFNQTLKNQLKEWQFSYNYQRLHGFLKGKTPAQYSEN